jgi:hypothetical protein
MVHSKTDHLEARAMPSPFPGMNPYLEHPAVFPGLHSRLITALSESLQDKLPAPYYAEIGERVWVEVSQRFVEPDATVLRRGEAREPGEGPVATAETRDYHVSVHRADRFEQFLIYPVRLDEPLPEVAIPLLAGDPDVPIDLQVLFDQVYDAGPYRRRIRYAGSHPIPPLHPDQSEWAARILAIRGE